MKREPHHNHISLLRTKLHRPPVPIAHVHRSRLLVQLSEDRHQPLVLVSAPAGYGKSTLVSYWLETCKRPGAWLSLDKADNDLKQFISYFIAAVQTIFPHVASETRSLLEAGGLPPLSVLVETLVNVLDGVRQDFIIVLDDIHHIQEKLVHDFLNKILQHPPRCMTLVLVGRRDPVISIAALRARGLLTELRMQELQFTVDESMKYLQIATEDGIEKSNALVLANNTEGWVTGLRLAVMAMRGQDNPDHKLFKLKGTTRYIVDYLVEEVLNRQSQENRHFLLSTAILNRFCAPLCEAVFGSLNIPGKKKAHGQAFIDWLQEQNLFIIPLDTENRWFRYHHLFQGLLKKQLQRHTPSEKIAGVCSQASAWFEAQGLIGESVHHALAAGDAQAAADVVERHIDAEYDANRWYVVDQWLSQLPGEVKQHRPKLLLTQARVFNDRFCLMEIPPVVERARTLLETKPGSPLDQGELSYFQGFLSFWGGDGRHAQAFLDKALKHIPESHDGYLRGQIELFAGLTMLMNGHKDKGVEILSAGIGKRHLRTGIVWERLKYGLAVVHFISGDLAPAHFHSRLFRDDGIRNKHKFIETWGDYLLGIIAFHRHDLHEACGHFGQVVENRYVANHRAAIDSMVGIAFASELLGKPDDADRSMGLALEHARWTNDETNVEVALSCEARIALLRGDLDTAVRWQRGFSTPPQVPGMIFFLANAWITECRVLSATGTKASLANASQKLHFLRQETESLHFTCLALEVIVLQAMVAHQQGRKMEASDLLKHAVTLAEPGGWIRPFVELGSPMAGLLRQQLDRQPSSDHTRKILAAFPDHPPVSTLPQQSLVEPLTHRELDVLELLSRRLQNKEIAEKLFISRYTVKAHLSNIYHKLQVTKRREAVEKATTLGILPGTV